MAGRARTWIVLPGLFFGGCLGGCTATSEGNGSFFLSYGTTLEFGHRTQVADPKQVSELSFNADKAFGMIQAFYDAGPVDARDQQPGEPESTEASPPTSTGPPPD